MKYISVIVMMVAVSLLAFVPGTYQSEMNDLTESREETVSDQQEEMQAHTEGMDAGQEDLLIFDTTDIFGGEIHSAELFAEHKVTMINIWASWCGPCIQELPELESLNQQFEEKDCAIIGLLFDGMEESGVLDAKEIMEETGVTYPVILPWDGFANTFPIQAVPTSFFVDSEGRIVGGPVVGAVIDQYVSVLDTVLAEIE